MIYVKDEKGRLKTLKEIAAEYKVSLALIQGRYNYGVRDIKKLIQPKWGNYDVES